MWINPFKRRKKQLEQKLGSLRTESTKALETNHVNQIFRSKEEPKQLHIATGAELEESIGNQLAIGGSGGVPSGNRNAADRGNGANNSGSSGKWCGNDAEAASTGFGCTPDTNESYIPDTRSADRRD